MSTGSPKLWVLVAPRDSAPRNNLLAVELEGTATHWSCAGMQRKQDPKVGKKRSDANSGVFLDELESELRKGLSTKKG